MYMSHVHRMVTCAAQVPYVFIGSRFIGGASPAHAQGVMQVQLQAYKMLTPAASFPVSAPPVAQAVVWSCHHNSRFVLPGGDETVALFQTGDLPELLAAAGATQIPDPDI